MQTPEASQQPKATGPVVARLWAEVAPHAALQHSVVPVLARWV